MHSLFSSCRFGVQCSSLIHIQERFCNKMCLITCVKAIFLINLVAADLGIPVDQNHLIVTTIFVRGKLM